MSIVLVPAIEVPQEFWPAVLFTEHRDWFFFNKEPRHKSAAFGEPPRKIRGNAVEYDFYYRQVYPHVWSPCNKDDEGAILFRHPKPIPDRGQQWWGDPEYYSAQTWFGMHTRHGNRWNDVKGEGYYSLCSFKIGFYKYGRG